jgi:hypothetical protein
MTTTLRVLCKKIARINPHEYIPSCTASYCVPDQIAVAAHALLTTKEEPHIDSEDDNEVPEVDGDDLGVE